MLSERGRGRRERALLARAKARLDGLDLYPRPVATERVRVLATPWLFALPWFRRFDGYTVWHLILLRDRALLDDEDLIVHELCHVWQQQHGWVRMWLSYLVQGYAHNRYETQARAASRMPDAGGAPVQARGAPRRAPKVR